MKAKEMAPKGVEGMMEELAKVDKLAESPKINKAHVYGRFFEKFREELLSGLNSQDKVRELEAKILDLPRYSFLSPKEGGVRRCGDKSGAWIERYEVIKLLEAFLAERDAIKHKELLQIHEVLQCIGCEHEASADDTWTVKGVKQLALRVQKAEAALNSEANQQADKVRELEAKYNELIMAVARKYPNETRHQTALRYINDAEVRAEQDNKPGKAMKGE